MNNNTNANSQRSAARTRINRKNKIKLYKGLGIGGSVVAISTALVIVISATSSKKNNKDVNDQILTSTPNITDTSKDKEVKPTEKDEIELKPETNDIDSIGVELPIPEQTNNIGYLNPTPNINVNEIVEDENGVLWINSDSESKKDEIGKETINGDYEVSDNGNVYEKEPEYQIIDENGEVISEGSGSTIACYEWDDSVNKYLPKDEVESYVIDSEGNMWKAEDYEKYQEEIKKIQTPVTEVEFIPMNPVVVDSTSTPSTTTTPKQTTTSKASSDKDIIPEEQSTYTDPISGLTFMSKEDYEQWVLQDFEGYGILNGIMVAKTDEMKEADKKVLTR